MAQKVSNFTDADELDGTEFVPVIQDGANRKTTVQDIADKANAAAIIDDAVPAFDKTYSSEKTKALVDAEATARENADTTLQTEIDLKLNAADYNDRFKGKYTTLSALQSAFPTANAGDYAQVDAGSGSDVINYNYDLEDGWIEGGSGSAATNTDALPEGSINLYFTAARAQAAVDISGKVDKIAGKQLSTEDYTTAEKTKLSGIAAGAQVNDANTTLQGNTFNGVSQLVKTDASGKLPAIDGSQLTNLPSSGGGAGSPVGTASGTNTYVVACTPTVTALTVNLCIRVKFTNGNTGASTINVDGLGAIAINQGPSKALTSGIITSGQIFELYYDGSVWQLGNTQAIPSTPNKVVTTDGSGNLQATNDLIDVNSTTTEATLIAATWTNGTTSATGTPGTWVLGTTSNYLYICTGTNTWIRIPAYLDYLDIYLGTVSDSGGVKTSAQMAALYPFAIRGQYALGTAGKYEYMGMVGWFYFANSITP